MTDQESHQEAPYEQGEGDQPVPGPAADEAPPDDAEGHHGGEEQHQEPEQGPPGAHEHTSRAALHAMV